jgi:uncharacterized protein (DUF488 family)
MLVKSLTNYTTGAAKKAIIKLDVAINKGFEMMVLVPSCHRRFIALELEKRGWQVSHIIDKERNWVPRKHSANNKQLKLT